MQERGPGTLYAWEEQFKHLMLCLKKNKTLFRVRAFHWSIAFSLSITSYLPFSHVPEGLLWDTHAPEF